MGRRREEKFLMGEKGVVRVCKSCGLRTAAAAATATLAGKRDAREEPRREVCASTPAALHFPTSDPERELRPWGSLCPPAPAALPKKGVGARGREGLGVAGGGA